MSYFGVFTDKAQAVEVCNKAEKEQRRTGRGSITSRYTKSLHWM